MADKEEKQIKVDVESILLEMEEMERWNGTTQEKIYDSWYGLKRKLAQAVVEKKSE
jgi:hypothetical protein